MPQYNPNVQYTFSRDTDIRPYASYSGSIPHTPGNDPRGLCLQIAPSGSAGRAAKISGYHFDTCPTANRLSIYVTLKDMYGMVLRMSPSEYPRFLSHPIPVTFPLFCSGSQPRTGFVKVFGHWS